MIRAEMNIHCDRKVHVDHSSAARLPLAAWTPRPQTVAPTTRVPRPAHPCVDVHNHVRGKSRAGQGCDGRLGGRVLLGRRCWYEFLDRSEGEDVRRVPDSGAAADRNPRGGSIQADGVPGAGGLGQRKPNLKRCDDAYWPAVYKRALENVLPGRLSRSLD